MHLRKPTPSASGLGVSLDTAAPRYFDFERIAGEKESPAKTIKMRRTQTLGLEIQRRIRYFQPSLGSWRGSSRCAVSVETVIGTAAEVTEVVLCNSDGSGPGAWGADVCSILQARGNVI